MPAEKKSTAKPKATAKRTPATVARKVTAKRRRKGLRGLGNTTVGQAGGNVLRVGGIAVNVIPAHWLTNMFMAGSRWQGVVDAVLATGFTTLEVAALPQTRKHVPSVIGTGLGIITWEALSGLSMKAGDMISARFSKVPAVQPATTNTTAGARGFDSGGESTGLYGLSDDPAVQELAGSDVSADYSGGSLSGLENDSAIRNLAMSLN